MTTNNCASIIMLFLLTGCTSFNAAMTPGTETIHDQFDGSTIIRQEPVSASSSLSEAWHMLGFEWSTKRPETVNITPGLAMQTETIQDVEFNVDGKIISSAKLASSHTEYGNMASNRRLSLPIAEFRKIAEGRNVKMKVTYDFGNKYSVSSFGQDLPDAIVSGKIKLFMTQIDGLRNTKQ